MAVPDALAGQIAIHLEKQLGTLVLVARVTLRERYRIEVRVKRGLGAVAVALLKGLQAERHEAAIAATVTDATRAITLVVMVDHQPDLEAVERFHDFSQNTAKHIKKCIRTDG